MRLGLLVLAILLQPVSAPLAAGPSACPAVAGLAPLLAGGSTLLLGELHGVVESPRFAGDAVCEALAAGRQVTLALELPAADQALLDAFVAPANAAAHAAARTALLGSAFWSKPYQDGRASTARLELLERLFAWRTAGRPVRVLAFDPGLASLTPAGGIEREQGMAAALGRTIADRPADLYVVLVGNIHSRVARGTPWDAAYEPMGLRLNRLLPQRPTTALDLAYRGGRAWMCGSGEVSSCGEKTLGKADDAPAGVVVVRLHPALVEGHHGLYDVGRLTASQPAAPH